MWKRAAKIAGAVFVGWIAVLFLLGFALGSRQERKTTERLAESLQALVTIDTSNLALIRGRWTFEKLAVLMAAGGWRFVGGQLTEDTEIFLVLER